MLAKRPKEQPGYVTIPALLKRLRQAIAKARTSLDSGNIDAAKDWLDHAADILDGKATW